MELAREKVKRPRRTQKQTWGPFLITLPDGKLSCSTIITRCHKIMAGINPDYDEDDVPTDSWLRRALRGSNVSINRAIIDLLSKAYRCTPQQHLLLLLESGQNVFMDSDGTIDPVKQALSKALTHLMSSQAAKKAVRHFLRQQQEAMQPEEEMYNELLQVAIQAREKEIQQSRCPEHTAQIRIVSSGAS